ncbi:asparagine synthase [Russula aff. rugulosa BPL654]|nr:asparagine synthase [Russula aff. rugulosa BPL654]
MCGIFAVHGLPNPAADRSRFIALSKRQRHRGPDWSGCYVGQRTVLVHERLAIVGVDSGAQPIFSEDGKQILAVNGEIYNHIKLRAACDPGYEFKTRSDCEVIIPLYRKYGKDLCPLLDGFFSFVLLDESLDPPRVIAARDPIGVTTLYQGWSSSRPETVFFSSELKSLVDECDKIVSFPPGHVFDSHGGSLTRYYTPSWWDGDSDNPDAPIPSQPADLKSIRETLEASVKKRLMSEVPYGVLLSGGLDSSIIAAVAARETEKVAQAQFEARQRRLVQGNSGFKTPPYSGVTEEATIASWPRLHSFSIGLEHSPDLLAARKAAHYLGTVHHEYVFTVQEGLDAIPDVISHLETYDVTTVRASTPMYLLSRKIKAMGVKMVLSGEGSDEIFGGYLYFHAAPDAHSFHQECVRRVKNLHTSDCLRANKSTMAWGLEARVPFLDKAFLEVAMNVRAEDKMFSKGTSQGHSLDEDGCPKMEKYILRKAFDVAPDGKPYLPRSILWRQKEQFSDGVGYSWIDGLKDQAERAISDEIFGRRSERWPEETVDTKEAYFIRDIFDSLFHSETAAKTAVRWIPRKDWGCTADPSGRSVGIHNAAYE